MFSMWLYICIYYCVCVWFMYVCVCVAVCFKFCVCVFMCNYFTILMLCRLPWRRAVGSGHVCHQSKRACKYKWVCISVFVCACVLPVAVKMHAAHSGRVSIQRVDTLARLGVPHTQRPVGGAADHRGDRHLTAPHAAGVTRQRPQTLRDGEQKRMVLMNRRIIHSFKGTVR